MEQVTTLFPRRFPHWRWRILWRCSARVRTSLLVGYAVRYRLRGSVGLCLGIAAGNGLYILLVVIGSGLLRQTPLLFTIIELLGAAYLLWVGRQLLKSRAGPLEWRYAASACPSLAKQLLLGLGSSLLNPKNALFYLALMTALLVKRDRYTAGHMWNLDDQRSVTLGSAADNAYRPAANSTSLG